MPTVLASHRNRSSKDRHIVLKWKKKGRDQLLDTCVSILDDDPGQSRNEVVDRGFLPKGFVLLLGYQIPPLEARNAEIYRIGYVSDLHAILALFIRLDDGFE